MVVKKREEKKKGSFASNTKTHYFKTNRLNLLITIFDK